MFGLISAGISLAGLGMNAVQAVQEKKRMREATAKSNAALQNYKNIQEENAFAALKAPDISSLQFDRTQRAMAQGVDAMSQAGAAGAIGGVTNLVQAGREADLQTAQDQGKLIFERDAMKAGAEQGINERKATREADAIGYEIGQANTEFNTASANKNAAISGMIGSAASAVGSASQDFNPATGRYKYKKDLEDPNKLFSYGTPSANYSGNVVPNYGQEVMNPSGLTGGINWSNF